MGPATVVLRVIKGRPQRRRNGRFPLWTLPLALLLLTVGCNRGPYPLDIFPEMHYQDSIRAQESPRRSPVAEAVPITGKEIAYDFAQATELKMPAELFRTPENLGKARVLYQVNCAMCHGLQGKGDGSLVAQFQKYNVPPPVDFSQPRTKARTEGQIWSIITNGFPLPGIPQPGGPGGMPSFKNLLTVQERWLLVQFVQSVQ